MYVLLPMYFWKDTKTVPQTCAKVMFGLKFKNNVTNSHSLNRKGKKIVTFGLKVLLDSPNFNLYMFCVGV